MKLAIVYWSGTGNTEAMANAMAEGAKEAGAAVDLLSVDEFNVDKLADFDGVLFGCPAMGNEVLEEAEFEPMFAELEAKLAGVPVGLFGSYGWGSGEWMADWKKRCVDDGAKVYGDGVIINDVPDEDGLQQCREYAAGFVKNALKAI